MREEQALSAVETQVWRELGRLVHALPRVLEDDMLRETDVTMTEFAVLQLLEEAPGDRLRMTELAVAAGLTASRITRVVNALAGRDLVRKERDGTDGRGNLTVLTDVGREHLRAAEPQHLASARRHVLSHLTAAELPIVADALRRLTKALA